MTPVHYKPHGSKFKVIFCFQAKQITKIVTKDEMQNILADARYSVNRMY